MIGQCLFLDLWKIRQDIDGSLLLSKKEEKKREREREKSLLLLFLEILKKGFISHNLFYSSFLFYSFILFSFFFEEIIIKKNLEEESLCFY